MNLAVWILVYFMERGDGENVISIYDVAFGSCAENG